jgi:hypothetical protein
MPAMWPPLDRTYRTLPPSSLVALYGGQAGSAGFQGPLGHRRVGQHEVRRRQRVEQEADR